MKTNLILKFIILSSIYILPVVVTGQGTLTDTTFFSPSLDMDKNIQVYLPEGYNPEESKKYPVVYFLHGAWDNHTSWGATLKGILNELIDNSTISPMIIVKPDGSAEPWAGSCYANSELYGDIEDYIVYDLISFIDTTYKTIPNRDGRTIWGLSMGGTGSMTIALKHPDLFCAVAAHSGGLDFSHWVDWVPVILSENGGVPVSSYIPTLQNTATYLFYTLAGAYSPNVKNTPYPVDFPLDSLGNFIDSTYSRWLLYDPVRLASNINQNYDLAFYFDCGKQDELLLYPFNVGFKDSLDKFGIKSVFESYEGGHSNKLAERFPIALSFLDSVMKIQTTVYNEYRNPISSFVLSQNYPNPFNPSTTIEFMLPKSEFVIVRIYNILGEEVVKLVNDKLKAGNHTYQFDGSEFASGIYMYRIEAGEWQDVKKMILIK